MPAVSGFARIVEDRYVNSWDSVALRASESVSYGRSGKHRFSKASALNTGSYFTIGPPSHCQNWIDPSLLSFLCFPQAEASGALDLWALALSDGVALFI